MCVRARTVCKSINNVYCGLLLFAAVERALNPFADGDILPFRAATDESDVSLFQSNNVIR